MDRWLGKTALVTGAASGIGKAITHALLRNGVNVTAVDIQEEKLAALLSEVSTLNTSGRLCTMYCDLSKAEDIDKVFAHIEKTYGGVDIMVNNAGIINYSRVIGTFAFASSTFEKSSFLLQNVCKTFARILYGDVRVVTEL